MWRHLLLLSALAVPTLSACERTLFSECGDDGDCYEDEKCVSSRCEIDEDADVGGRNEPCVNDEDCHGDNTCVDDGREQFCRELCTQGGACSTDGFTCVPLQSAEAQAACLP
jgi:hypothetical protein